MADRLQFIANLTQRQSSLMLSGQGDRCLIELEAFQVNAALALVGMVNFTGRSFLVTIEELPKNETLLDDEEKIDPGTKKTVIRVGRRRTRDTGDQ